MGCSKRPGALCICSQPSTLNPPPMQTKTVPSRQGSNVASLFSQTLRPFLAAFSCSSKSCMVEDASCQRGNKLHENVQKCKKQKFMLCCDFRSVTVCSLTFSFFLRLSSSWSRRFLSSEKMSINASCSLVADSSCLCRSST